MRQRRVGTISMGVLLIMLGAFLLYAQINQVSALGALLKWWPLVLFLLGTEVLLYAFLSREENPKIKYDIFSIFIIILLILAGVGLYGITEVGVISGLNKLITAQDFELQLPTKEIELSDSVRKIVVVSPRAGLHVRTGTGEKLAVCGEAHVSADSLETAKQLINRETVRESVIGDTLYIAFDVPLSGGEFRGYHARIREYMLVIPGDRMVEIASDYTVRATLDNLKNNWTITESGAAEIIVYENADVTVEASVDHIAMFRGNADWNIEPETEPEKETDKDDVAGRAENGERTGRITMGKGDYKVRILGRGNITVNKV